MFLLLQYWVWHYYDHPQLLFRAWRNFLVFGWRFFSIPELVKTLFAPYHKYQETYGRGFDIQRWLLAAFSNLIFRGLGFIVRVVVMAIGLVFEILTFTIGLAVIILWLALPFLLIGLLIFSLKLLGL